MFHRRGKRRINGCLYQYAVTLFCKCFYSKVHRRHYSITGHDPLRFYFPVKTFFHPFLDSFIISFRIHGITVKGMLRSLFQSILNTGGRSKIHICYPQRQHVICTKLLFGIVIFCGVCTISVYSFKSHRFSHTVIYVIVY